MLCRMLYQLVQTATNTKATFAITTESACVCSIEDKMCEVGEFLNYKLHNLASTMIANDKKDTITKHWT